METITKLYDYLDLDITGLDSHMKSGHLTENIGRDGESYFWYFDGRSNAAINISTGEIVTDESRIEELFC